MVTLVLCRPKRPEPLAPNVGCAHQTPGEIEERWALVRRLHGSFVPCPCCRGPTLSWCCPLCEADFIREISDSDSELWED